MTRVPLQPVCISLVRHPPRRPIMTARHSSHEKYENLVLLLSAALRGARSKGLGASAAGSSFLLVIREKSGRTQGRSRGGSSGRGSQADEGQCEVPKPSNFTNSTYYVTVVSNVTLKTILKYQKDRQGRISRKHALPSEKIENCQRLISLGAASS